MLQHIIKYFIKSFSVAIIIIFSGGLIHFFILEPSTVNGRSMENTLFDSNIVIIDKLSLLLFKPRRGQLVSAFDEFEELFLVKRIIGLPGESIIIKEGKIFIVDLTGNTSELNEPYLKENNSTFPEIGIEEHFGVINENEYFLLGDNRKRSVDSRRYGTVHRSRIIGAARKTSF